MTTLFRRPVISVAFGCLVGWILAACGGGNEAPSETAARQRMASEVQGASAVSSAVGRSAARQEVASTDAVRTAATNTIYASVDGNDSWSGSTAQPNAEQTDGPVRTIAAAQTLARARLAAMSAGDARAEVRVKIMPGTYRLNSPLQFTPADSGTPEAMVHYEAVKPGTVVVSGGVLLDRSTGSAPAGQMRFNVPASLGSGWNGGGQLYVNDKRAVLARQPNAGQPWFVKNQIRLPEESGYDMGKQAFTTSPDAHAWIAALSAADRSRAIVNIMQSWTDGHHRLSDLPTAAGSLRITPRALSPFKMWGLSQRLYIENVAAALDAPGEWLWDASGARYVLGDGENASNVNAVMPLLDTLVVVKGDIDQRNWVQNLWISGITFAHTRYLLPNEGAVDVQAAVAIGAAIEVDGAVGIVVDDCRFEHMAGNGVWFRRAVRDSRVTNSIFKDMGAGGVKMGQAKQLPDELPTGANSAVGNLVSDTGKLFKGGAGIWVGQSFDNLVANNAIFNTTYSGISVGWTWGYDEATSGRNRILNNLLRNIGQAEMSDMGGIYTLGISPGTVIRGNVVREVRGYPGFGPGVWGLHGDEGTSYVLLEDNIVVGSDSGGYGLNFGRDITLRNNLFAYGSKFELRVAKTDPNSRIVVQDTLLVPLVQQPFDEYAMPPDMLFSGVQVSNAVWPDLNLGKCGGGCTTVSANVMVGADARHIRVTNADSATVERYARIAREAGPAWLVSPTEWVNVPVGPLPVVPLAPPAPLTLDIAGTPAGLQPYGSQPTGVNYRPSGSPAISIVQDGTAPLGNCLAFNDSASFPLSFYPYMYASLNHDRGVSTVEFTVKIDANTLMSYEWRDGGNPYKSGPALEISPAGIRAGGPIVAHAPIGRWLRLRISAPVDNPSGTWTLEVTDDRTATKTTVNDLPFASAGWSNLVWMGFMSNATTDSKTCLGSFDLTSSVQ